MGKMSGVVTAQVKSVNDPDQQGRVQLSFPYLGGQNDSTWAPVATLMAGGDRGSWFMPEVGDEVLVAFNQDDVAHPFVIGFLWNGQNKPPVKGIDARVRRLRTVSGHQIDFDDIGGEEKITITTKGGHKIQMNDTPGSQGVTIATSGNQQVQLQDTPASVTIQTAAQNQVTISDAPPGISISAPTGNVTVTAAMATLNVSSVLNVTAPMTIFSGVVQAQVLIATAVVGSAYTPAPGNTLGL